MRLTLPQHVLPCILLSLPIVAAAADKPRRMDEILVIGHYDNSIGSTDAATAGIITSDLIADRPLLRPGQLLEYVPGLVVTQHSGSGKANQYFLRGFNLDHGTDFATSVAGMPVNMRTHGHGQGYTDINFVIPELISQVNYFKGPYYASVGDFGSAGGADMLYTNKLAESLALGSVGDYGYQRALLAASQDVAGGTLTGGAEYLHNDGPWDNPDDYRKLNGLLRYTLPVGDQVFGLTAMGYSGRWNSTDQVPQRAVDSGDLGRFDTIDDTSGGTSERYSLSADYSTPLAGGELQSSAYWIKYQLNLISNFTYFLSDPVNGDQFEQADDRNIYGGQGEWSRSGELLGHATKNSVGLEVRQDRISPVGLYATASTERLSTVREDRVTESSAGLYAANETKWTEWFRSNLGLRYDLYKFKVTSDLAENTGTKTDGILSPKVSLVFGPWANTEYFVNGGLGFHSNDARGVTISVDPVTGDAADPATPLVRSSGAELGLRTEAITGLQSSLALWYLHLDSELVFVGDAGATEAGRPSNRYGVEWSNRWQAQSWLFLDLDVAWNHARFSGSAPEGDYIPGAPDTVVSAGISVEKYDRLSGSVFYRYIGSYALLEDNSERSEAQSVVDAQVGYEVFQNTLLRVDVFNIFDSSTNDITYYYESRLPGEPTEGIADVHYHPGEKRSFRVSLTQRF